MVLHQNELYVKKKCLFAQEEVSFLGLRIKDGHMMMEHDQRKPIDDR